MPTTNKEFIQAVKDYRAETGEGLRVAIDYVQGLVLSGKVNFKRYDGPYICHQSCSDMITAWNTGRYTMAEFINAFYLTEEQAVEIVISAVAARGVVSKLVDTLNNLK